MHFHAAVRCLQAVAAQVSPAARLRGDEHLPVPGLERCDPADGPVHPVRDGAERVVVELVICPGLMVPSGSIESQRSQIVVAPIVTGYSHDGQPRSSSSR